MARTALITGANRGLGLETARQLGAKGWRVVLTSRSEPEGYAAAHELVAEGMEVEHRLLDVAGPTSIESLADGLRRDGIRLDALVNNAAVAPRGFNADILQRTLDVNFYGAERVTDALLPLLEDGASIVMVSSSLGETSGGYAAAVRKRLLDPALTRAGLHAMLDALVEAVAHSPTASGWPASAYRISKAALNALTRILAGDLAGRRIRVNAICPGWVRTDMGTASATRSVEEGAASIVWAAALETGGETGGFFRDGRPLPW